MGMPGFRQMALLEPACARAHACMGAVCVCGEVSLKPLLQQQKPASMHASLGVTRAIPPSSDPPAPQAVQLGARPATVVAFGFPPADHEPTLHLAHAGPP